MIYGGVHLQFLIFISEGSHFLTFRGTDFKDEILEEKKVFTVINSDPVIYSPLNGLETSSNQIDIYGFYEPDKRDFYFI